LGRSALCGVIGIGEGRKRCRIVGVERAAALAEQIGELGIALVDAGDLVLGGLLLIAGAEDIENADGSLLLSHCHCRGSQDDNAEPGNINPPPEAVRRAGWPLLPPGALPPRKPCRVAA
jgi:hypothetical protein